MTQGGGALPRVAARTFGADELLGRAHEAVTTAGAHRLIEGSRVLVTGGGGSIGSELARQVAQMGPEALYVLDHDESAMHAVQLRLSGHGLLDDDFAVLADIRDRERIRTVIRELRPDVIFHAAAHKHLPLLERYPVEGVKTNVLGTQHLVDAACEFGVDRFILVSTDKAATPSSVLGSTKRLAELIVAQAAGRGRTRFASVRFGNVLGSRGSFLDTLDWQVANNLPVTVTHPEVTRFFMTVPEAVGLVIEAAVLADNGETYVLDMGGPIGIRDLVRRYGQLAGRPDLPVTITGLRPGEKLHEVLYGEDERTMPSAHARISMVPPHPVDPQFHSHLMPLYAAAAMSDGARAKRLLDSHPSLCPAISLSVD